MSGPLRGAYAYQESTMPVPTWHTPGHGEQFAAHTCYWKQAVLFQWTGAAWDHVETSYPRPSCSGETDSAVKRWRNGLAARPLSAYGVVLP